MSPAAETSGLAVGLLAVAGVSAVSIALVFGTLVWRLLSSIIRIPLESKPKAKGKTGQSKTQSKAGSGAPAQRSDSPQQHARERGPDLKTLIKESKQTKGKQGAGGKADDAASHHHLFLNTLKGHGDAVHSASWSGDGMQLVTACEDLYVRAWDLADVTSRDPKFRRIKAAKLPVGAGFGDAPDSVAVLMRGIPDTLLSLYSPSTGRDAPGSYEQQWTVNQVHGKEPPLMMRCAAPAPGTGRRALFVSLSTKKEARVYGSSGRELALLEPNSLANHDLAVSADGRFVAVASFTAEVKIWEVKRAKESGEVTGAVKAMELKGHKSQVAAVSFSPDARRAVTVSKDGTLRVWNIDVRYHLAEDPKTLLVIPVPLAAGRVYQQLAFGPRDILAASSEGMVHLLSATTGELLDTITDAHDATITSMQWCPRLVKTPGSAEAHPVLATSSRDKRVRLWRAP